jgi:hypothetical protein
VSEGKLDSHGALRTHSLVMFFWNKKMSETLDLPVALANAPFDSAGKTVGEVAKQVRRTLRKSEIEPERVTAANFMEDENEAQYGLKSSAEWPDTGSTRHRLCLSVARGNSEGWIVQVDFVRFVQTSESGHWNSLPLMWIKTLNRAQAWSIAAVVSRLLDID